MPNSVSLEAKKAYTRKSCLDNYIASMKLEGFDVSDTKVLANSSKSELIAKLSNLAKEQEDGV